MEIGNGYHFDPVQRHSDGAGHHVLHQFLGRLSERLRISDPFDANISKLDFFARPNPIFFGRPQLPREFPVTQGLALGAVPGDCFGWVSAKLITPMRPESLVRIINRTWMQ